VPSRTEPSRAAVYPQEEPQEIVRDNDCALSGAAGAWTAIDPAARATRSAGDTVTYASDARGWRSASLVISWDAAEA